MGDLKGNNHYLIRFLYLLIAWCVAIKPIFLSSETSKVAFCSTLFLFFVPLTIDYLGMSVNTKLGVLLKNIGFYSTLLPIVVIICITFEGLEVDLSSKMMYGISFYVIWLVLLTWIALSFIDWIYFSYNPVEQKVSEEIVSDVREGLRYNIPNPMDSRIDYHEKQYEAEIAASNEGGIER